MKEEKITKRIYNPVTGKYYEVRKREKSTKEQHTMSLFDIARKRAELHQKLEQTLTGIYGKGNFSVEFINFDEEIAITAVDTAFGMIDWISISAVLDKFGYFIDKWIIKENGGTLLIRLFAVKKKKQIEW